MLLQNQTQQAELIDLLHDQLVKQAHSQALAEKTASEMVVLLDDATNALKAVLGNSRVDMMEGDVHDLEDCVSRKCLSLWILSNVSRFGPEVCLAV
jgi:hypothetical protein